MLGDSPFRFADYSVIDGVLSPSEASAIVSTLKDVQLDMDEDTVDGKPTYELYLLPEHENDGTIRADAKAEPKKVREQRAPARKAISSITKPALKERLTPLVNEIYADDCGGNCVPCFSVLRKIQKERAKRFGSAFRWPRPRHRRR